MNRKTTLFLTITLVMALASVNAAGISVNLAFASQGQKFTVSLSGQNEVPPTNTKATGSLEMELSPDGTISHYTLNVTNIGNVISAQIHEGVKGTNGPLIVYLIPYNFALFKDMENRTVISWEGKVLGYQFEGPLAGKYLSDLISLINNGMTYVNVNTKQHPQGEIRGQLQKGVTSAVSFTSTVPYTVAIPEFGIPTAMFVIVLIGGVVAINILYWRH